MLLKNLHDILFTSLLFTSIVSAQEIALTFDDAPTSDSPFQTGLQRTETLIKKLKNLDVLKVTFFVVTSRIDSLGLIRLQRYADAGHIIANHSHSHTRIHRLGVENYIQDIFKADSVLRKLNGYKPWFRFPFLDEGRSKTDRDKIRKALADRGYLNGFVTVDNYDWYLDQRFRAAVTGKMRIDYDKLKSLYISHLIESIRFYDEIAVRILGRSPKHVLLLHENDLAALYIDDLVKSLRQNGCRIISPEEAYRDPIAARLPDVIENNQGRVVAIAKEMDYTGSLRQESENTQYWDKIFKTEKVFRKN